MANIETVKDKAGQLTSEVGTVVGQATDSLGTQARGVVDVAKDTVQAKVAEFKVIVDKEGNEAKSKILQFRGGIEKEAGQARAKFIELVGINESNRPKVNFTSVALGIAGVAVILAIAVELIRAWPAGQKTLNSWTNKRYERAA